MLYFVSVNGIDADYPLDDYDNFIFENLKKLSHLPGISMIPPYFLK